ncbi:type VI secretion system protein ImpJ [Oceanospirillum multiglobuliferum]|uniref:Type VI secretion system-associated protein n=1 Tax=Oceanospirillum multiglobuliferum TaxID=64969 RepID=A0A1T4MSI2_9GAMM|nr:type VI secretion system baseplate subunit TssK [Oceanospirillum multiglobuliferum]OPX56902.1 type VI secretion system-associated protein [Oceanospirillum multiglobuliferum]SJZ70029.1 type VI secretion system protein ImpJ [Oceanospirillum multiglobuliferum]
MNTNKPLYWHQGLFLQPNHFQYQDSYNEFIQSVIRRTVAPMAWGVAGLKLDSSGLESGLVSFDTLRALLPDGVLFSFPENARLEGRLLDNSVWPDRNKPILIYLGLRKRNEEPLVQIESLVNGTTNTNSRFIVDAQNASLSNRYEQSDSVDARVLSLVGKLWFETELAQATAYDLMPVMRLLQEGDQIKVDPSFIPPCITLRGATALVDLLRGVREEVLSRTRQLEDYKQPATTYTVSEFNPRQMRYRLALQVLSRYVQSLSHLLEIPDLTPERAYSCMRELIAELSVFTPLSSVTGEIAAEGIQLPSYNHLNLGLCFTTAQTLIHRLLNEITVAAETLVKFDKTSSSTFSGELPNAMLERKGLCFLIVRTELSQDAWLESFRLYSKLGASSQVELYEARALPGLGKKLLTSRPEGLPNRPNSHYFSIDVASGLWQSVESDRALTLIWPNAPDDLRVELVFLRG